MKKERGYFVFALLSLVVLASLISSVSAITDAEAQDLGYLDADEYYDVNVDVDIGGIADEDARLLGNGGANYDVLKKIGGFFESGLTKIFGVDFTNGMSKGDLLLTKILVYALIVIIIFGVTDMVPFFPGGRAGTALKVGFSVIVAYLSIAYIAPAELYTSLMGYGSLAVALIVAIPFVIILGIYAKLATDPRPERILIARFLALFFMLYYIYRLFVAIIFPPRNLPGVPVYAIITLLAACIVMGLIFASDTRLRHYFLKAKMKGYLEEADLTNKDEMRAQVARMSSEAAELARNGDAAGAARLSARAHDLTTYINTLP